MSRTRSLLLTGACIAATIAQSGCSSKSRSDGESRIAAWLGPDTVAVAGIQLEKFRGSPLSKALPAGWLVALEPFQQASQAWAAYDGKELLVIARGQFPPVPPGAVLAGRGLVLAGAPNAIKAAEQWHVTGPAGTSRLLEKAEPLRNEPIWAVIRGDAPLPLHGNGLNFQRALEFTEYTAVSARWKSGVELSLTGYCATPQKAQELEESLRAMVTLAKKAARAADLAATLVSVRIGRQQSKVLVSFTAAPAILREMLR